MPTDWLTVAGNLIVFGYLVVRDVRSGTGASQRVLIDLLKDTINVQQQRINQLSDQLAVSQGESARLNGEMERLKEIVQSQAQEITDLKKRRHLSER